MQLRTKFRKALFAGVAALATGTALAEMPTFDNPEDFLIRRGLTQNDAQAMVRRLAGKNTVGITDIGRLNQLRAELIKAETSAKAKGDEKTVRKIGSLSFRLSDEKSVHPQDLAFDKNPSTIHGNKNLLEPIFGKRVPDNDIQCLVKIDEEQDTKKILNSSAGIPFNAMERSLLSFDEMFLVSYLHELAHCNGADEEEADIAALQELPHFNVAPDLARRWIYFRALKPTFGPYYIALPIDASRRRLPVPHVDTLADTFDDLQKQASQNTRQKNRGQPEFLAKASAYRALLNDPSIPLKPLSRRMMELHLQATEAVAPKAYAQILPLSGRGTPVTGPLPE